MSKRIALLVVLCVLTVPLHAQTAVTLAPVGRQQFFSASGAPLANGCLFTYLSGSSTPAPTYIDQSGLFQASNPIILDGGGFASIWVTSQSYRFVLVSAGGTNCASGLPQWTIDGVNAPPFLSGNNTFTGNNTFSGTTVFSGSVTMSAGGTMTGTFAGAPTFSGSPTFTGVPIFTNQVSFPSGIDTDQINGTITTGGQMNMVGATGSGLNNGESIVLSAGAGGATGGTGGTTFIDGGIGGASGGPGGVVSITAGAGVSANAAGGAVIITSGAGTGAGLGGNVSLTGGLGGATAAAGGQSAVVGGMGGAGGPGGNVLIQPGAAGAGGARGQLIEAYGSTWYTSENSPTCAVAGAGSGATCTVDAFSGNSDGLVSVLAGTSPGANGTITLTFASPGMGIHGGSCMWSVTQSAAAFDSRATIFSNTARSSTTAIALWDNNGANFVAADTYLFAYHCIGAQ